MTSAPFPPRGFPDSEFEARLARAQRMMAAAGLDALMLTSEPEVRYFSGFLTQFWQSPTRPWFLVVPKTGKPIAVIPEIGALCMGRTWIEDIRTWPAPDPTDDGLSLLGAALREAAGPAGRIGLAMGRETHLRMPLADFERLRQAGGGAAFADAAGILRVLRMVKSEAEIAKIGHICALVSDAFAAVPDLVHAGESEIEAFRAFKIDCLRRGADDVPYLVGGSGPGGYGDIISPPSSRRLGAGDVLCFDTGSVFDGYYCDFHRNFAIGPVSDPAKRAYATLNRAVEAGLAAARPGARCADLFQAMQHVLEAGGALGNVIGRLGHGLGMQLTEGASNAPWDETALAPGMVLTLEPAMAFAPGRVMVLEENVAIREDGPELLTRRAPDEMPIIS